TNRAHSVLIPTDTSIIQAIVSASAYPAAFPLAFASQTIPLPGGLRLTPSPRLWRASGSFPRSCASFGVTFRVSLFAVLLVECVPDQEYSCSAIHRVHFGPSR